MLFLGIFLFFYLCIKSCHGSDFPMCPAVFHLKFDRKSVDRTSFLSLQPGLFKLPMMLAFDNDFMHRITVLACLRYQQPSNHPLSLSHFFFSQFGLSTLKFMFLSKKYIMNHLKKTNQDFFLFLFFFSSLFLFSILRFASITFSRAKYRTCSKT